MIRSWRAARASVRAAAEELADELLFRAPEDIDVRYAAAALGAIVRSEPIARGDGAIVASARGAIISVDERVAQSPRGRFAIAHEVGHLALHAEMGLDVFCRGTQGRFFQRETDATDFASALLAPTWIAAPLARGVTTLAGAKAMAATLRLSLSAALQRLLELTDAPLALVASRDGAIVFWCASDAFPFQLKKGFELGRAAHARSRESLAFHRGHGAPEPVCADAWTRDEPARGAIVLEESIAWRGGALTLLGASG